MAHADDIARLAAIVDSSDDAILSAHLNGNITSWNLAAERLYGYGAADAIGRPAALIVPSDRHDDEQEVWRRVRTGEPMPHYESVRVRKDGTRIDVDVTVSALRAQGGPIIGVCTIGRDITVRRHSDRLKDEGVVAVRRLAAIVESTDDAVVGMDLDGAITAWNPAAERMYGFSAAEAIGRSIRIVVPLERQQEESLVLERAGR